MNNRPIRTKHDMDYETFKSSLQEKIQSYVSRPINFIDTVSSKINETQEALAFRLDGEKAAPLIYPQKLYEYYWAGVPLSAIAADAADTVKKTYEYPPILDLTPENAQKCIRFALINKERNQKLLETCLHKDVLDLAAVPRWYADRGSFLVDNGILPILGMTGEEVLAIAEKNTESERYICSDINSVIQEAMLAEGVDAELLDRLFSARKSPLHVLTSQTGTDGSRAILSDRFMQEAAQQMGADELCLVPSSRNEMIAAAMTDSDVPERLKHLLYSANRDPAAMKPCEILSDSVYSYNAKTHSLSVYSSTPTGK